MMALIYLLMRNSAIIGYLLIKQKKLQFSLDCLSTQNFIFFAIIELGKMHVQPSRRLRVAAFLFV